jgi:hypothetical protein
MVKNTKLKRRLKLFSAIDYTFGKISRKISTKANQGELTKEELEAIKILMLKYATKKNRDIFLEMQEEFLKSSKVSVSADPQPQEKKKKVKLSFSRKSIF